jgi:predicted MFS family arabinose efflux permease
MTAALESSDKVTERARTGVLLTICICVVLSMSTWFSTAAVVPLTVQLGLSFALTIVTIWLALMIADCVGWRWAFLYLVPGPIVGLIAMMILRQESGAQRRANLQNQRSSPQSFSI